jgi:hypothetical protein
MLVPGWSYCRVLCLRHGRAPSAPVQDLPLGHQLTLRCRKGRSETKLLWPPGEETRA